MPDSTAQPVLRRKLAPPRPRTMPGQQALQHMLAKTMPRDADDLIGLQLAVTRIEAGRVSKPALIAGLHPSDLVFLMLSEPPSPGLCTVSASLLAGLIEVQMSGRVSAADPPERAPTPVDGIVVSNILDRWMATAKDEAAMQDISDCLPFVRHHRSRVLGGARSADLALDPVDFNTLSVTLDLDGGTRTGVLFFAVPAAKAVREQTCKNIADDFRAVLMDTATELSAVLTRMPQSLGAVKSLAPGDILDVPIAALGSVTLEDDAGKVLARGRLGQTGGKKAVRLTGTAGRSAGDLDAAEFLDAGPADKPRRIEAADAAAEPSEGREASPDGELPDLPDLPERSD